jgi:hypothetical protein
LGLAVLTGDGLATDGKCESKEHDGWCSE